MASSNLERKRSRIQTPYSSQMSHRRAGITKNKCRGRTVKRSVIRRRHRR